jgi:predicted MFS family arabinose efflux permease
MKSSQSETNGHAAGADETTPLIASIESEPAAQAGAQAVAEQNASSTAAYDNDDDRPLPKFQLFLLCYARMMEPIAFFCIFPFVNKMIEDVGKIKEQKVGLYSGWIESLFSLTQMVAMIPYGRVADRIGRKPVLVWSLCGCSISMACFGFSRNIWQMILFRCLAGTFAGTVM